MTGQPRRPERPAAAEHLARELGAPSPWRALFAVIPMIVIVAVGAMLLGSWSSSLHDRHPDAGVGEAARNPDADGERPQATRDAEPPAEAAPRPAHADGNRAAPPDAEPALFLLADADPAAGARLFRMCMPCHAAEKGARHKVGPTLWNVLGRDKAGDETFAYSAALKAKGGAWTYAELTAFLRNPRAFAPGTSMAFAGLSDPRRLADLLAYMRTLSDAPAPLPD